MRTIRFVIRGVSLILAAVVGILAIQLIEVDETRTPFNTNWSFEIDTSQASGTKDELIDGLTQIADRTNTTLVKVVADPEDYEQKRDVFWFGTNAPDSDQPPTNKNSVDWFQPNLTGAFLPASEMGDRPLAGRYYASSSPEFELGLTQWAAHTGVSLFPADAASSGMLAAVVTTLTGVGNASLAVSILLVASLLVWFALRARSRSLRLLGGVPANRIHVQDVFELAKNVVIPMAVGLTAVTGYVGWTRGIEQFSAFVPKLLDATAFMVFSAILLVVILSLAMRPTVNAIARRQIPLRAFSRVGSTVRFIAVTLSIIVLPAALAYAQSTSTASRDHSLWESMRDTVRISFNDMAVFDQDEGLNNATEFFREADSRELLTFSFVVDANIAMTDHDLGPFDHLVVTDESFLLRMGIGIEEPGSEGQLTAVSFDDLGSPMQSFIEAQFPLWTVSGEPLPESMALYTYTGPGLAAAGQNVGLGGETVLASSPLVVVVDKLSTTLDTHGFLLPAASTGNILFTDADALRSLLAEHQIAPYIASIDHVSDLALTSAQDLAQEARLYFLAAVLIMMALVIASVQSAHLWTAANERRVFTLHSSGLKYGSIVVRPLRAEGALLAVACVVGGLVSISYRGISMSNTLATILIVSVVYALCTLLAYRDAAQRTFVHVAHRQH